MLYIHVQCTYTCNSYLIPFKIYTTKGCFFFMSMHMYMRWALIGNAKSVSQATLTYNFYKEYESHS